MIDTEIIFLNSGNIFNVKKIVGKNTFVPLKPLDKTNKKKKSFVQEIKDNFSIKKLEENITNIFIFHQKHNNLPTLFPEKIYFNFLRDTYYEQYQHYKNQDKETKVETENQIRIKENLKSEDKVDNPYEKYAEVKINDKKFNTPRIDISTEHVRNIVKLNSEFNGAFLNSLKNNFSRETNQFLLLKADKTHKIVTELVILHEVAHWISAQKLSGTILSRSFKKNKDETNKPNFEINHLNNISRNILEGFSDCFAIYLTQQHYKEHNIVDTYQKCREETSKISQKSVSAYDLSNIFNEIKKLSQSSSNDMDKLTDKFLEISINNALNITEKKINNDENFKKILEDNLNYYAKEENVKLNSSDLLTNLRNQLTQKIPTSNIIINQTQAIFNISNMRNKYINSENETQNKLKM